PPPLPIIIRYDFVSELQASGRRICVHTTSGQGSAVRLIIVLLLVLGGAIGWLWWSQHQFAAPPSWQGYAEADYGKVAPVTSGTLTAVLVARGDVVAAGAPLFAQDATQEQAARDQAARQLTQAEQQLANLQSGGKPTEIDQAEANLADARSTLLRAQADLLRGD